jgi:hypothetical protein
MKTRAPLIVAALLLPLAGCGSPAPATSTAPTTTTTAVPAPAPTPSATNLTGTWTGTGTDAQGPETFSWSVTQTGDRLTGSVVMDSANPNDGTCGSCHKRKTGTLAGTLSGGALSVTLDFPQGGTDITPLCGLTMNATTTDVAAGRITATYTGTTTCEGPITDGKLTVTR